MAIIGITLGYFSSYNDSDLLTKCHMLLKVNNECSIECVSKSGPN